MEKRYLDYEIMLLDMEILKKEVEKLLVKKPLDREYLNDLFNYGCWGDKTDLIESDADIVSKAVALMRNRNSVTDTILLDALGYNVKHSFSDCYYWERSNYSDDVILSILQNGVDINLQNDKDGYTALMIVAAGFNYNLDSNIKIDSIIFDKILEYPGIDVNIQDNEGRTALMHINCNDRKIFAMKLLNHPDINLSLKDNDDRTHLMYFATYGGIEMVKEILNRPETNVNDQRNCNGNWHDKGYTALMFAAYYKNPNAIKELLKHPDIDPNLQNEWGETALMIAIEKAGSMGFKVDNDDLYIIKQLAMRHPDIEFRVRI